MARQAVKKKTTTIRVPRNSAAGRLMEEKQIGLETVDWANVKPEKYEVAIRDTLRHYGYFYDNKEGIKWAIQWMKPCYTKDEVEAFKNAETWRASMTMCGMCKMLLNGAEFDAKRMQWLRNEIATVIKAGLDRKPDNDTDSEEGAQTQEPRRKSPAELIAEKASEFIAELEGNIDDWGKGEFDVTTYSLYDTLRAIDAPAQIAKAVADFYKGMKDEIEELVKKKTPDLLEGYSHLTIKKRKELLKFLETLLEDADKYQASKKAKRKVRAKKPITVSQQISKIRYQKESAEYKVTSIDPSNIVGAGDLWLFNTKTRTLTHLVADNPNVGFTVKGTTVQGINMEQSSKKKLRKPEEILGEFLKGTKARLQKQYEAIKTKPSEANGRINEETIILKAFK